VTATLLPADGPALDAWIDRRIVLNESRRGTFPKLSFRQKLVVGVFVAFMVASLGVWWIGFSAYRSEVDARIDGNCETILKVRSVLEDVLDTATAPRPTEGVTDLGQLYRTLGLNQQLAAARERYLPAILALRCD
jgi:hypothetical protein